ncbi:PREDICTED: pecanex-like protein 1 [Acropora digitifera]|uniref:pecanex-like protein 1 n=1 Tax=Acropora digitifera TaxID=70779 RepID=UPI00077AA37D|nr:PREDICTED: pecanex-like protein 1 [Acropora digitifera]
MQHADFGGQNVLFSVFCGLLVAISYHLSRSASDPSVLGQVFRKACARESAKENEEEFIDPLPGKLTATVTKRLQNDVVCCIFILVFVFAIHLSTVFTSLQPYVSYFLYAVAGCVGILNHYLWPQLHKPLPWLCFAKPFLRSREFNQYEVKVPDRFFFRMGVVNRLLDISLSSSLIDDWCVSVVQKVSCQVCYSLVDLSRSDSVSQSLAPFRLEYEND